MTMTESDPFTNIQIKDKDGFDVAILYDSSNTITNDKAAAIEEYELKQEAFEAGQPSNYEIIFKPTNVIPSQGAIQISWPDKITVPDGTECVVQTTSTFTDGFV